MSAPEQKQRVARIFVLCEVITHLDEGRAFEALKTAANALEQELYEWDASRAADCRSAAE